MTDTCAAGTEKAEIRPFSYWLVRYPPGWISRTAASKADPLALTHEIYVQLTVFAEWLAAAETERWDNFPLQSLSATLFNRYISSEGAAKRTAANCFSLLELDWPAACDDIQSCLKELQQLLAPPFAVFKAVRSAVSAADMPTAAELKHAERFVAALRPRVVQLSEQLRSTLESCRVHRPTGSEGAAVEHVAHSL